MMCHICQYQIQSDSINPIQTVKYWTICRIMPYNGTQFLPNCLHSSRVCKQKHGSCYRWSQHLGFALSILSFQDLKKKIKPNSFNRFLLCFKWLRSLVLLIFFSPPKIRAKFSRWRKQNTEKKTDWANSIP